MALRHFATSLILVLPLAAALGQPTLPPRLPRPTQAQVARRFLLDVLAADYPAAYRRLAPEVRSALRPAPFAAAARPLWQQGQQRGPAIELYKLGARFSGSAGRGQWFYSFAFAADSAQKPPAVLLEVTFRDTTARQVLGFGLRRR